MSQFRPIPALPYLAVCVCGWAARRQTFVGAHIAGEGHHRVAGDAADHVLNVGYDRPPEATEICPAFLGGRACKRPAGHRGLHDLA